MVAAANTITEQNVWRAVKGAHLSDTDAAIIGPELERLAALHGAEVESLSPDVIVEAAREASSPLHPYFEWDLAKAAAQMWREQAGYLVRSIRVTIVYQERGTPTRFEVPAFVSVKIGGKHAYTPVRRVLDNPELLAQARASALRELMTWRDRYRVYEAFSSDRKLGPIIHAIDLWDTDSEGGEGGAPAQAE